MTDKQQPDTFDWATELSDAQGHVTLSKQEAKEIGARLRSMGAKLKTYEDLGGAGSDVQLLRMGYAAARLEIESLRARCVEPAGEYPALPMSTAMHAIDGVTACWPSDQMRAYVDADRTMRAAQPAGAQQPSTTPQADSQPAPVPDWLPFSKRTQIADRHGVKVTSEFNALVRDVIQTYLETNGLRASHGQAPAQAAPAVAGPHVTDAMALAFHSALSDGALGSDEVEEIKAGLRAALAAAPTTQPAPQQEPSHTAVQLAELVLSDCGHSSNYTPLLDRVAARIDSHVERRLDELRGRLEYKPAPQQEAQEPVGYTHASWIAEAKRGGGGSFVGRKNAAFDVPIYTAPPHSPAAQGDALDAARLDWLRDNSCDLRCVDSATGQGDGDIHWIVIEHHMAAPVEREIGRAYRDDPRAAIDAARAAQEGANHG